MEAVATRLEAIARRLEAIGRPSLGGWRPSLEAIASRLERRKGVTALDLAEKALKNAKAANEAKTFLRS